MGGLQSLAILTVVKLQRRPQDGIGLSVGLFPTSDQQREAGRPRLWPYQIRKGLCSLNSTAYLRVPAMLTVAMGSQARKEGSFL
jgi:hypothetical protein